VDRPEDPDILLTGDGPSAPPGTATARHAARLDQRRREIQGVLSEALVVAVGPEDVARAAVDAVERMGSLQVAVLVNETVPEGRGRGNTPTRPRVLASAGFDPASLDDLANLDEVRDSLAGPAGPSPCVVVPRDDLDGGVLALFRLRGRTSDLGCLAVGALRSASRDEAYWDLLAIVANWTGVALERSLLYRRLEVAFSEARDAQRRLLQAEKQSAIGRLAAGLAHEIGTPLNVISGRAEMLQEELAGNPRATQALHTIVSQIDRITGLVGEMLDFAREHTPARGLESLNGIVSAVVELLQRSFQRSGIEVRADIPRDLPQVRVNRNQMQQVFLNLLINSVDAVVMDPERSSKGLGHILVHAEAVSRNLVQVRIEDDGHGIEPAHLDKVFDPFFSTKPVGQGTGLGLAVVYGIVTEHGGTIDIQSRWTRGTTVTFTLPAGAD